MVLVGFSGSLVVFWRLFFLTFRQSLWPASSEDSTLSSEDGSHRDSRNVRKDNIQNTAKEPEKPTRTIRSQPWKPSWIQIQNILFLTDLSHRLKHIDVMENYYTFPRQNHVLICKQHIYCMYLFPFSIVISYETNLAVEYLGKVSDTTSFSLAIILLVKERVWTTS